MAEIQRASDGNDDYEFWKVCTLFISVHLKLRLFPPLSSASHEKRHQSIILASLNFFWGCFTRKVSYLCVHEAKRSFRCFWWLWCFALVISLRNALLHYWLHFDNRSPRRDIKLTAFRLEWKRKIANFILVYFILLYPITVFLYFIGFSEILERSTPTSTNTVV